MNWEVVDVRNRRRRGEAYATITNSKISFNGDACDLVDIKKYKYVEVLKNPSSKLLEFIGVKFIKESTETSFSFVARKSKKDGSVNGVDINSHPLIAKLFGERGVSKTSKYGVSLDQDNKNIIVIDLNKEM